jgi:sec-independent protein translocase protein TatA
MPIHIGATELIILVVIVLAIFGAGRIGRSGADLGRGIRDFRKALSEDEGQKEVEKLNMEK